MGFEPTTFCMASVAVTCLDANGHEIEPVGPGAAAAKPRGVQLMTTPRCA
jgi:hypothetical protein